MRTIEQWLLLRAAAIRPRVFNAIWRHFGSAAPSRDILVEWLLENDWSSKTGKSVKFNRDAASRCAKCCIDSFVYAGIWE